jgi:hypothetical protein
MKSAVLTGILLAASAMVACGPPGYAAYVVPAPPAPYVVGAVGYAPSPGYVWVDGFWNLNAGRWVWVNGRWAVPPRGHALWVADRWERRGNGWRYRRGHWR